MFKKKTVSTDHEEMFHHLLSSARAMGEISNLNELLDFLAKQASQALRSDRCSIFLIDEEGHEVWSKVSMGTDFIKFSREKGIASYSINTGHVLICNDPYNDLRFNREVDKQTGYKTKNLLSVAMRSSTQKIMGSLELINKWEGEFTDEDAGYLQAFANQAALAIEMSLLYQDQSRMLKRLELARNESLARAEQMEVFYHLEKLVSEAESLDDYIVLCTQLLQEKYSIQELVIYLVSHKSLELFHVSSAQMDLRKIELPELEALARSKSWFKQSPVEAFRQGMSLDVLLELLGVQKAKLFARIEGRMSQKSDDNSDLLCVLALAGPSQMPMLEKSFQEFVSHQIGSAIIRFKLSKQQEENKKFALIGQLASSLFHDFRSPLSIMQGFVLLAQKDTSPTNIRRLCQAVTVQVGRCSNMIDEMLSLARGEKQLELQPTNLDEFMDELEQVLQMDADRRQIHLECIRNFHGQILMDRGRMMRVLLNLCNNAFDVLKPGEHLKVSSSSQDNGEIEFRVTDSGPGIDPKIRSQLFQMFFTHGKQKGTGLGLYLSREIVESHSGQLYLDEKTATGASFVIRLPSSRLVKSLNN
ncbi:MAG: GAF domain-containing sensor histidine kinase [Proteobacteria bacterium]|nr:GAF domain-containing sensor histidine kinase [Pseudomonadota bacterium]